MTLSETLKRIRLKCLDCCGQSVEEVTNCAAKRCAIYELRFGKNPSPSRRGNPAGIEAIKKARKIPKQE
ncbi:MAG TPA: hypothetical protein VHY08_21365 [Bacillota bacterium]|nr:hypothetical protein [Bacillota bacterium]